MIFQFGDDLADSGNYATLHPNETLESPYGYTWPGCFKGRFSDGRLLVDFYATTFGVRLPRPWSGCDCGTNFAVAGATALKDSEFAHIGIPLTTRHSLKDQLKWFKKYLESYPCQRPSNGLYILGIGGLDYILAAQAGVTTEKMILSLVPEVVTKIVGGIQMLVKYGAKNIIVENIPPSGCSPMMLTEIESSDLIDEYGCLVEFGEVIQAHNRRLNRAIFHELNISSNVIVALEDRYSAFYNIWKHVSANDLSNPRVACCGGGGPYNFNASELCGMPGATICSDPSRSLFWDSFHFTDHYNDIVSRLFLAGNYMNSTAGPDPLASMC